MIFLPFLISSVIGFLFLDLLFKRENGPGLYLKTMLGIGLGLGISSHLTFSSFLLFNDLVPRYIITAHLFILCALLIHHFLSRSKTKYKFSIPQCNWPMGALCLFIAVVLILVVQQGSFYPYGGWDAWQVWNFKAKFLLLAGDAWHNLFSEDLWRSSPHYPLLLPCINVWGWLFTAGPVLTTPLITSILFTVLTAGTLSSALWERSKNIFSLLPGLLILTLPFFDLLATSQYCDIIFSFYLLVAITTWPDDPKKKRSPFALSSGLFAGFLSFTKPEGLIAALILSSLIIGSTALKRLRKQEHFSMANAGFFFFGFAVTFLPTFAFNVLYSPGNQTFINGLASALKPSTGERLNVVLIFLLQELMSGKWNGLWFLILGGLILGGKQPWVKENALTAVFLFLYLTVILAYYEVNTYFEIKWWLSVSLNRILFSLLPLALFWVFNALLADGKKRD